MVDLRGRDFLRLLDFSKEEIEQLLDTAARFKEMKHRRMNHEYLKGYYYTYSTSLNSDTLTKASDAYEYEVESKETTKTSSTKTSGSSKRPSGMPGGPMGESRTITNNITTVITKTKETFQSSRKLTGDFELDGYSSYDAMTEFVNGTLKIEDGEMITDFSGYECVISSELATLNEIKVGDTITLKNPNTNTTYDFVVKGIYKDNSDSMANETINVFMKN